MKQMRSAGCAMGQNITVLDELLPVNILKNTARTQAYKYQGSLFAVSAIGQSTVTLASLCNLYHPKGLIMVKSALLLEKA